MVLLHTKRIVRWLAAGCLLVGVIFASEVQIEMTPRNEPTAQFVLKGLSPQVVDTLRNLKSFDVVSDLLRVYVVVDGKAASTAMSGDVEIRDKMLVFTPRYPLRSGMTYRVVFEPRKAGAETLAGLAMIKKDFELASSLPAEPTRLTAIYPSGDVLPENLLRLYLYFSAPMRRGEAYERIQLIDEQGKTVAHPFLELGEELWSPDGKRFTLYFDPGRIKRGLQPREMFGPALLEGGKYSLVIDAGWLDANGRPLATSGTKKFRVVVPDDKQPNPRQWQIQGPHARSREPLVVTLDEPLDSGMLQRVLEIRDAEGKVVVGDIRLSKHEQQWEFVPDQSWHAGSHRLIVSTGLEDLAGNSIRRLFEIDILRPAVPGSESEVVELPFVVK